MFENPTTVLGPEWPTRDEASPWARGREILGGYLKQAGELFFGGTYVCNVYPSGSHVGKRARALLAAGFLSVLLRDAYEHGRIKLHQSFRPQNLIMSFPTPACIPFHLLMDVPLPFTPDAAEKFSSCHLAKMTTVDFLQDGEWTGFCATSFDYKKPGLFEPPIRIRFAATAKSGSATTLYGKGEEAIGTFTLKGILAPATGDIDLRKIYRGGLPALDWKCLMTPVGIVGCWGFPGYGGWLWLWKTGWTADL